MSGVASRVGVCGGDTVSRNVIVFDSVTLVENETGCENVPDSDTNCEPLVVWE